MPKNKKAQPSIFEKLTDSKKYTGSHQHRFDAAGKGRGLAGRDRISKGTGTSSTPYTGGAIQDMSQILRPNLRMNNSNEIRRSKPVKTKRCKNDQCVNLSSPTSPGGFCAYHMWQEKEATAMPKEEALFSAHRSTPQTMNLLSQNKSTTSLCCLKKCSNDKATTSSRGYCSYHSWKEHEELPKSTPEVINTTESISSKKQALWNSSKSTCVISECSLNRFKMGYCQLHYTQMLQDDEASNPLDHLMPKDLMLHRTSSNELAKTKKSSHKADKILAKLTDSSQYTGSHQHRFDQNGKGRGLDGRDSIAKGGTGFAKYHGGVVRDISQILRQ